MHPAISNEEALLQEELREIGNPDKGAQSAVKRATKTAKRVVVIADDDRDCSLLSRMVRDLDYSGICISDKVVPLLQDNVYAIVVSKRHDKNTTLPIQNRDLQNIRTIVASDRPSEDTILQFLDAGARHVFDLNESETVLSARLHAALRQHRLEMPDVLSVDDIHFDVQKRRVTRSGSRVELSPKEFEFARHIFCNIDKVVSNNELMTSIWSLPSHMNTRRIDTAACNVRKKLGLVASKGWELKRIRRVGYRLVRSKPCD